MFGEVEGETEVKAKVKLKAVDFFVAFYIKQKKAHCCL
jgi:hypothetical protein